MGWVGSLQGQKVGLDTAPFIYFTEENPTYFKNTAIKAEASFFLTNDIYLSSLPNLKILLIDELLKAQPDER
jgi:hypothetical protein